MAITQVRNELYVPQNVGRIKAITVMSGSKYTTLADQMRLALQNPQVAEHYIQNRGVGNFVKTSAYYGEDDSKDKWVEGGDNFKIIDRFNYEGASREGSLELPSTGWVKAYKDGNKWKVWDFNENGGFARYTTQDKSEAEESFKEAGFDPRLVSKQWRREEGYHGLTPVIRNSNVHDVPLVIDAGWDFEFFDFARDNLGSVLASGSEQKAGLDRKELSANALNSDVKTYAQGLLDGQNQVLEDLRTMSPQEILKKYER